MVRRDTPRYTFRLEFRPFAGSAPRIKSLYNRASARWLGLSLVCFVVLWFFLPVFSGFPLPLTSPFNGHPLEDQLEHDSTATFRPYPPPPRPKPGHDVWNQRAQKVRQAFLHAWNGYREHAMGYDELTPVDGGRVNNFNGWGVTIYDALDTMWIMGLHDAFQESVDFISKSNFTLAEDKYAPFFETVIRYLGGLLSAYALSGEPTLLSRADDLGSKLLPAFNSSSGLPYYAVNTVNGKTRDGWSQGVLWAEALSNQMEYKYLAHLTGRTDYFNKTENIMQLMYKANITSGLYPTMWSMYQGIPINAQFSVGAYADSAHEYLLKQYLLTGKSEPYILDLYLNSINGVLTNLLYTTPTRNLLYVTDKSNAMPTHNFEHLSCFLPGLLALGVHTLTPTSSPSPHSSLPLATFTEKDKQRHLWAAQGLAETCWATYADQHTGLGPDEVQMNLSAHSVTAKGREKGGLWIPQVERWEREGAKGFPPGVPISGSNKNKPLRRKWPWSSEERKPEEYGVRSEKEGDPSKREYRTLKTTYLLRPETIESFYYLWRITGEEKWRERGWSIFQSIEKYTKTEYGYASLIDVDKEEPLYKNEMPSYFLAETLKYLFLLFTDNDLLPFDKWVFNTEAHPFPIFAWQSWEKQKYNISSI